jgi:hypothetical protein
MLVINLCLEHFLRPALNLYNNVSFNPWCSSIKKRFVNVCKNSHFVNEGVFIIFTWTKENIYNSKQIKKCKTHDHIDLNDTFTRRLC